MDFQPGTATDRRHVFRGRLSSYAHLSATVDGVVVPSQFRRQAPANDSDPIKYRSSLKGEGGVWQSDVTVHRGRTAARYPELHHAH
jgi:hypothetical protein